MLREQAGDWVRARILARRAAFVASALGGLGLGSVPARAQSPEPDGAEPPPPADEGAGASAAVAAPEPAAAPAAAAALGCPSAAPASDEVTREAAGHYLRGVELYRQHQWDEAVSAFRRSHELAPSTVALYAIGKLEQARGRSAAARAASEKYLACTAGELDSLRRVDLENELAALRQRTALVLLDPGLIGANVALDGEAVATTPAAEPLFVGGGTHRVAVLMPDGRRIEGEVHFPAGGEIRLTLDLLRAAAVPPQVCLSPPPPPPPEECVRRRGSHLGLGVAPQLAWEARDGGRAYFGGALEAVLNVGLSRSFDLHVGAGAAPSGAEDGLRLPVAGALSVRLTPFERFAVATGFSAGYLLAPEPSRAAAGAFEPASGLFVHPEISPLLVRLGDVELDLRLGAMLSRQQDLGETRFGLSYLTGSVWATYLFLPEHGQCRYEE
ncbi:MAG: tetratricopeptide repeat protein [Deltaproteobacteria bacterium]|nr:tetratricopeptide repeat protein [Deltaproteobacteria bacterium]